MKATIHIYGPSSVLLSDEPLPPTVIRAVAKATSYFVAGYKYTPLFRQKKWDGRKHLYNKRSKSFPTGLVQDVSDVLKKHKIDFDIDDHREVPEPAFEGFDLAGIVMEGKYSYQKSACEAAVEGKQGIIKVATGGGKCLGPDVEVLLYSGDLKKAKHIQVGDLLMGPDSTPREVLSTCVGTGPMYKVRSENGSEWTCNDVHVMTLRHETRGIVDIPLNEFLSKNSIYKDRHSMFSKGVSFPADIRLEDPYFLGLFYAAGLTSEFSNDRVTLSIGHQALHAIGEMADKHNLEVAYRDVGDERTYIDLLAREEGGPNPLLALLRRYHDEEGTLHHFVLTAPSKQRWEFLSGYLDAASNLTDDGFEVQVHTHKRKEQVEYLVRSLGGVCQSLAFHYIDPAIDELVAGWVIRMRVNVAHVQTKITGYEEAYTEHHLAPIDLDRAFVVEPIGEGPYAGFTLAGDGRFLLKDFAVTHNTEIAGAITKHLGLKTLFLVPSCELMYQSQDRFIKRLGLTKREIGIIGDGEWAPGTFVTVAIAATLKSRLSSKDKEESAPILEFLSDVDVLFIDECHSAASDTFYIITSLCPAYYRFGLSATPLDRTDGADLRLLATTGPVRYNVSNKQLVDLGVTAKADIVFDSIRGPVLPSKTTYATAYKSGQSENPEALAAVVSWVRAFRANGLSVMILVEEISHGKLIDEALWNDTDGEFIPHQFIHGSEDSEVRQNAISDFDKRDIPVLICSRIADQGLDVHSIDGLILAGSKKSKIKTMQRLGRGLRGERLVVVEFANYCHKHLTKHSLQRLNDYQEEKCFPIHIYKDTEDKVQYIKQLWDAQGPEG